MPITTGVSSSVAQTTFSTSGTPGPSQLSNISIVAVSSLQSLSMAPTPLSSSDPNSGPSDGDSEQGPYDNSGDAGGWDNWNEEVKIGLAIGVTLVLLLLAGAALFLFRRRKQRLEDAKFVSMLPLEKTEWHPCPLHDTSKASFARAGSIWPERVALTGESKEILEWTNQYDREYKRRLSMTRDRLPSRADSDCPLCREACNSSDLIRKN